MLRIFIGYDKREHDGYIACTRSLRRHSNGKINAQPIMIEEMQERGLFNRPYSIVNGQRYDEVDGRPFSTDFTYTRFLVPTLCNFSGWALFCDLDFMFRSDIIEIVKELDDSYAVMCVKHNFNPDPQLKMDNQIQVGYPRKNWSSFIAFNCSHSANEALTVEVVNSAEGRWLHRFGWLEDSLIGELGVEWNYLVGHNSRDECPQPKAVHFTLGIPSMPGYEDQEYSNEWKEILDEFPYYSP